MLSLSLPYRTHTERHEHAPVAAATLTVPSWAGLPAELRVLVYSYIFGRNQIMKPRSSSASLGLANVLTCNYLPPPPLEQPVYTAILSTNKLYYQEGIEELYQGMTVRATIPELLDLIQIPDFRERILDVEIADCINGFKRRRLHTLLQRLRQLRQIKSIVILSDCLGYLGNAAKDFMPVYEFCDKAKLGMATCYDVGKYSLEGKYEGIEIHNRRLVKMWPEVQSTPAGYDAWEEYVALNRVESPLENVLNRRFLVLHKSLRCWVGVHDFLFSLALSGELARLVHLSRVRGQLSQAEKESLTAIRFYAWSIRPYLIHPGLVIEHGLLDVWGRGLGWYPLRSLGPGHGRETLSAATEYLSINIAGSRLFVRGCRPSLMMLYRSHWAAADGGLHTIDYRVDELKRALTGGPSCLWIPNPLNSDHLIDGHVARDWISRSRWLDSLGVGINDTSQLDRMTPMEIQQLTYLAMARDKPIYIFALTGHSEYADEVYVPWAEKLLTRYLSAIVALPDQVERKAFREILTLLERLLKYSLCGGRTAPAPTPEFHEYMKKNGYTDLYVPLVWKCHLSVKRYFDTRPRALKRLNE